MRTLRRFFKRLSSSAATQQDEERLRAEIEEHLALQTADNVRAGLSPAEARRQAVLKFGGVDAMKESYRDERGLPFLETLIQTCARTFIAGRFLGSQLYGMSPYNAVVTLAAVLALGLSALLASFVPALRASLISPADALRAE